MYVLVYHMFWMYAQLPICFFVSVFQSMFFFLAQTEQGDIFKITLETDEDMVSIDQL